MGRSLGCPGTGLGAPGGLAGVGAPVCGAAKPLPRPGRRALRRPVRSVPAIVYGGRLLGRIVLPFPTCAGPSRAIVGDPAPARRPPPTRPPRPGRPAWGRARRSHPTFHRSPPPSPPRGPGLPRAPGRPEVPRSERDGHTAGAHPGLPGTAPVGSRAAGRGGGAREGRGGGQWWGAGSGAQRPFTCDGRGPREQGRGRRGGGHGEPPSAFCAGTSGPRARTGPPAGPEPAGETA